MIDIMESATQRLSTDINQLKLFVMEKDLTPLIKKDPSLLTIGSNTIIIRQTKELKDDKKQVSFLIICFSGLVLYMGNTKGIEKLQKKFDLVLKDITNDTYDLMHQFYFPHDFLFWLFIKLRREDFNLIKGVTLKNITDTIMIKPTGPQSFMGDKISSSETKNVTKSLAVINCLLSGYKIRSSTFRINFQGYEPAFQLIKNRKIYFMKDKFFDNFLKIEQFITGIFIIQEFIKIYKVWKRGIIKGNEITQKDYMEMAKDSKNFSHIIQSEKNIERAYRSNQENKNYS